MKNLVRMALIGALLAGCAGSLMDAVTTLDEDDALRVKMYEKLFELEPNLNAAAYCLTHGTADAPKAPSNPVLAALANNVPKAYAESDCQSGREGPEYNGGRAVAYNIQPFERTGNTAVVEGYARRNAVDMLRYRCNATKTGDVWQITGCVKL